MLWPRLSSLVFSARLHQAFPFPFPFSRSVSSGNREECVKEKGGVSPCPEGTIPDNDQK